MADTVNAFVTESFTLANDDTAYLDGAVIELPANQFADLKDVGLVRLATDAEVTAATAPGAPVLDVTGVE